MRILMLNEAAAPVGGEMNYYVLDVADKLRASGDVVALVHQRLPKSEFRGAGYIFDHLRKMGAAPDEVRIRLEAIVDDFKPDVIQIHGVPNLALDPWLAAKAPTVRWVHNHRFYCSGGTMTLAWPGRKQPCRRPHGPACLALHTLRGCGSPDPLQNLVAYRRVSSSLSHLRKLPLLQVASEKMKENLIRNGIDPARIEKLPLYASPAPSDLRKAPPTPRRFILQPGGLVTGKGVWILIRQIEKLPADVDLVFAGGGGALEQPLKKFVARHGLSKRVRIMGEVNPAQWRQLFSQATLVVMPSLWNEPLGLAGLYAMAHGKPVIAFQGSGIDEWLENDHTGIAVAARERVAFVETVGALLSDPARLQKLGKQAAERWNSRFKPEHHLAQLRACYARLLGIQ